MSTSWRSETSPREGGHDGAVLPGGSPSQADSSEPAKPHRWNVPFERIECLGCGEARIRAADCPECGSRPDPREVNTPVRRRDRVIGRAQQVARASEPTLDYLSLHGAMEHCRVSLDGFMSAIDAVLDGEFDESVASGLLGAALGDIASLRSAVTNSPRRRPFVPVWAALEETATRLAASANAWVQAFECGLPIDAQRRAEQAQSLLDEAAVGLVTAADELADLGVVLEANETGPVLGFLAQKASERAGGGPTGFAEEARALVHRLAVRDDLVDELAPGILIEDERARLLFDRERFWGVAAAARAAAGNERLGRLSHGQEWAAAYQRATEQLADAGEAAMAMAARAYNERQLVRSDLYLAKSLIEGPIKFVLGVLLAIEQRKTLSQILRGADATSILNQTSNTNHRFVSEAINEKLRHAEAHEDYFVLDGELQLGMAPAQHVVSRDELTDDVLAIVETAVALHLGLTVAMLARGGEAMAQAQLVPWSSEQSSWLAMSLFGAAPESVEIVGQQLVILVSSPLSVETMKAVAGTVPYLASDMEGVEVHGPRGVLAGPLDVLRRFQNQVDDDKKQADLMRIMSTWHYGDTPLLSVEAARLWAARRALDAMSNLEPRPGVSRMRSLIDFAKDLDDPELVAALRAATGAVRGRLTGLSSVDRRFAQYVDRLREWATADVSWPPTLD